MGVIEIDNFGSNVVDFVGIFGQFQGVQTTA